MEQVADRLEDRAFDGVDRDIGVAVCYRASQVAAKGEAEGFVDVRDRCPQLIAAAHDKHRCGQGGALYHALGDPGDLGSSGKVKAEATGAVFAGQLTQLEQYAGGGGRIAK